LRWQIWQRNCPVNHRKVGAARFEAKKVGKAAEAPALVVVVVVLLLVLVLVGVAMLVLITLVLGRLVVTAEVLLA